MNIHCNLQKKLDICNSVKEKSLDFFASHRFYIKLIKSDIVTAGNGLSFITCNNCSTTIPICTSIACLNYRDMAKRTAFRDKNKLLVQIYLPETNRAYMMDETFFSKI